MSVFAEEWTGVTLFMAPSPDYKPHKDQKNGLLSFIPILVKQRGLIANIVLATLLVTVINIVGSYYLQSIIDTYVPDQMRSTLGIISIGLVIVYILQQILSYAQEYLLLVLGQRLSIDVICPISSMFSPAYVLFCDTQDRGNRVSFYRCQQYH